MESHANTARRTHLAFAAAGIIAATMLAVTVKAGLDMASYLETTALTTEDLDPESRPAPRHAAPMLNVVADPAAAAGALETRDEDAADLRLSDRTVAAAP